ncbi:MAG: two-component system LytT family response regulator [Kangiellaceae bacterium]|jgi:DNA-binding LytR/AlgR family response regulator
MQFSKEHFQKHKFTYEMLALVCYFGINATINATTVLMEEARKASASFQVWEPFAWEYSSALATLVIFPLIAAFMRKYPWDWQTTKSSIGRYIVAALTYGALHILLMVAMREFVYLLSASDYQFSISFQHFLFEFLYELRKDVWSFCFFVAMIGVYRYIITQWLGDAQSISNKPDKQIDCQQSESLASILLVKKLGKEFLIKTKNIEWVEACGNYANLHIENEIYPMRTTMSDFILKSRRYGLIRVHRSFAVNVNRVHFIESLASGDSEVVMQSGKKIRLSRRYKIDFETLVADH